MPYVSIFAPKVLFLLLTFLADFKISAIFVRTSEQPKGVWPVNKVTICRILNAKYTQHANDKGYYIVIMYLILCTHSLPLVWYMFTYCYNNFVIYLISQFKLWKIHKKSFLITVLCIP